MSAIMEALGTFEDDSDNVVALPSFATLATLEVVAEMVDRRRSTDITLATLEVVAEIVDMKTLGDV